jgi:hypothetical protein
MRLFQSLEYGLTSDGKQGGRFTRRELGGVLFGALATGSLARGRPAEAAEAKIPAPKEETLLSLIEERRGVALTEGQRKILNPALASLNHAWRDLKLEIPDGTEPDFVFRPAPLPRKSRRRHGGF